MLSECAETLPSQCTTRRPAPRRRHTTTGIVGESLNALSPSVIREHGRSGTLGAEQHRRARNAFLRTGCGQYNAERSSWRGAGALAYNDSVRELLDLARANAQAVIIATTGYLAQAGIPLDGWAGYLGQVFVNA